MDMNGLSVECLSMVLNIVNVAGAVHLSFSFSPSNILSHYLSLAHAHTRSLALSLSL